MRDIQPKTHSLIGIASFTFTWLTALTEWIDNSIDAGATQVKLALVKAPTGKWVLTIDDDGCGKEDLDPFFQLGAHEAHANGKGSGLYGFGGIQAALWVGGENSRLEVQSTRDGYTRGNFADWKSVRQSGSWQIEDPQVCEAPRGEHGTKITVTPVVRQVQSGESWERTLARLAWIYSPAIKRGVQIQVRKQASNRVLVATEYPPLRPGIVDTVIHINGKSARLYAGIVQDGAPNPHPGLTYMHRYRALSDMTETHLGCGGAPTARIFGVVDVDDSFKRTTNKTGLRDPEEVVEAVERAMAPITEEANRHGMELRSSAFASAVEAAVNAGLALGDGARASRPGKGGKRGTQASTGIGPKHMNATVKQPGGPMPWRIASGLRVTWHPMGTEAGAGRIAGTSVMLNTDCALVRLARDTDNVLATKAVVDSLVSASYAFSGGDRNYCFSFAVDDEDASRMFGSVFGNLLSAATEINGSDVLSPEGA